MPSGTFPDPRLEVHFATLRASSLKDALKRSAGNWQMYAAVTGSAMAMATSSWGGSPGGGGSGGGTGSVHRKKQPRYEPRLQFPPK